MTVVVKHTFLQLEEEDCVAHCGRRPRSFSDPCTFSDDEISQCTTCSGAEDETVSMRSTAMASSKDGTARWADIDVETASEVSSNDISTHASDADSSLDATPIGAFSRTPVSQWTVAAPPGSWTMPTTTPVVAPRQMGGPRTSLILKNIPSGCTRTELLGFLDSHGFWGQYNLVYVPTKFKTWEGCGYAFVNMVHHEAAEHAINALHGFSGWCVEGMEPLDVSYSDLQGLEVHVERYRNSPVCHPDVPAEYKPLLLAGGRPVSFPAPTRKIKAPPALKPQARKF